MISVKALVLFATLGVSGEAELLYFWAPWCQPCRTMQPVVARLESAGFPIRHVDIDREPQLAQRFGVQSVPCFVMLHRGQEVDRVVQEHRSSDHAPLLDLACVSASASVDPACARPHH